MVFLNRPSDFDPKLEIVSCFCEAAGKILLLHRHEHKPQGNTWGVPAGKIEEGEDLARAMVRELYEETQLLINPDTLFLFDTVYVRYAEFDFVYHLFHTRLPDPVEITINPTEHTAFLWVTPHQSLSMNLIQDEDACIRHFYSDRLSS
jgi:8-oxo-dGTP pyrophosphatase MutT (NUDIX family)